jgi:hypothetical protein
MAWQYPELSPSYMSTQDAFAGMPHAKGRTRSSDTGLFMQLCLWESCLKAGGWLMKFLSPQ